MSELINCTAEFLGLDASQLHEDTDLQKDLGLSSFDLMELSCELEEHFHVKIAAEELANVRSLGDLNQVAVRAKAV